VKLGKEVSMNSMDVRVIGASALTAAAVSVVVVLVSGGLGRRDCPAPAPVVINHVAPAVAVADEAPVYDDVEEELEAEPVIDDVEGCAESAKERGMSHINMGQHAAALAQFEASLRCQADPYVVQLAFMESCASSNSVKAKLYYKQLTPAQQTKFAQICIRQKPPVPYE
jgi:hypothetical protein